MEPTEEHSDDSQERRVRTLSEKGKSVYQQELNHELKQTWVAVQRSLHICEQCPNDIIELWKAERNLSSSFNKYCHTSGQYQAFLSKTNTGDSISELELHVASHDQNTATVQHIMENIDTRLEELLETASHMSHSSRRSAHSNMSSINTAIVKQQAKAEAAKAQATYALHEAELRKRHAVIQQQEQVAAANAERQNSDLKTELELLQHQKNIASATAELKAMRSANASINGSVKDIIHVPTIDPEKRTKDYIDNISVYEEQVYNKDGDILNNIPYPSVKRTQGQIVHQTDSQILGTQPSIIGQCNQTGDNIKTVRNVTLTNQTPVGSSLNPNAPPYISSVQNIDNQTACFPAQRFDMTSDFTSFLLKRELLLTRLYNFNDKPENYTIWKLGLKNIVSDLQITPSEELDLLVKWLGPTSSKHAVTLRAANARDPSKALLRVWERLEERYGCPEMIERALKEKITNFPKLSNKETTQLYELCDILSEIQSIKEDNTYSASLSYYDTSSGVIPIVNKLPYGIQEKWTNQAARYKKEHRVTFPPFSYFVNSMREIDKIKNDPSFSYESNSSSQAKTRQQTNRITSRKTDLQQPTNAGITLSIDPAVRCPLHNTKHPLNDCRVP